MPKSISRKRKRKFGGNQFTKNQHGNASDVNIRNQSETYTASSSKLENSTSKVQNQRSNELGNIIFDLNILSSLFTKLCCLSCHQIGLILSEDSKYGLCSNLLLRCCNCDFCEGFSSCAKVNNAPEINMRFVYGMRQMGKGYSSGFKLCETLNLPMLSRTAYANIEKKIFNVVKEVAESSMKKAANAVVERETVQNDEIVKCGVSVDGTWQRRGYTSMNGCVAAISIETGASLKMETVGATRIYQRSIKERNLQYAEYYGDGDSKAFMTVKNVYGENSVKNSNV